jgi:hypothetical protein
MLPSALAAAAAARAAAVAAGLPPPPPPPPALSFPPLPPATTRAATALLLLAPVRVPGLRAGRTVNPAARASNLEAVLVQHTGQTVSGCTHCAGGSGPWVDCVVAPGFLSGSCANCHYGSEGGRCSFRKFILLSVPVRSLSLLSSN